MLSIDHIDGAEVYDISYSVTNSVGLTSEITQQVRVLAPSEAITSKPYSFNVQGEACVGSYFVYTPAAVVGVAVTSGSTI